MEMDKEKIAMLDLMQQPAFCVEAGRITHVNPAAKQYFLTCGQPVSPMITAGREEYEHFCSGCLHITITLGGSALSATVTKMDNMELWLPEQPTDFSDLRALALAAAELRKPLSGIMSATDQLFPAIGDDPAMQQQAAQINRRLFQMLRSISNMSDAVQYASQAYDRMEYVEMAGFVEEIFEKTAALAESCGICLSYRVPQETIFTLACPEKLERAIYNLLSNAMKYTPAGGCVEADLICREKRLYLSVCDSGSDRMAGDIFTRFRREPGLYDSRWGIGLGMVLVRATAAQHGGAVLLDRPDDTHNRVTLSFAIQQPKMPQLSSPILRIDYAGQRDHCLLELSDVLPAELYCPENIN